MQVLFTPEFLAGRPMAAEFKYLAIFSAPAVAHLPIDLFACTI